MNEADLALASARMLFERGNHVESIPPFERARELARLERNPRLEAEAELGHGEALFRLDHREEESLPHLRRASELGVGSATAALAWLLTGEVLRFLRRHEAALDAFEMAAGAFKALGDATGGCLAEKAEAVLLRDQGRYEEALAHVLNALDLALEDDPEEGAGLVLLSGELLKRLDRRPEAAERFSIAAEMYRALGNTEQEGRARAELVGTLGVGEASQAQIVRMSELLFDRLAREHVAEDDAEIGAAMFLELARAHAAGGETLLEARCRCERARLLRRHDYRECVNEYVQAAELFHTSGSPADAADAYYSAANILVPRAALDASLRQEALTVSSLAAARSKDAENWRLEGMALFLGATSLWKDDPTDPDDPRKLDLLQESAESFLRAGLPADAAQSHCAWAMQLAGLGFASLVEAGHVALDSYERGRASLVEPGVRDRTHAHVRARAAIS